MAFTIPTVMQAASVDDAFDNIQFQIVEAYYVGDHDMVAELFSVLFELLVLGSLGGGFSGSGDDLEIETDRATDIEHDEAELHADLDWDGADRAYVWFEYGEDRDNLEWETSRESVDDDDDEVSVMVYDLDEDERYYFRAVAEDRDTDRMYYGDIESFYTDDRNGSRDEEPNVDTDGVDDVTDDSARLYGSVDMNDYRNGIVFFVWGEDEDQVEDVDRDYDQYSDVDEDGDDLQKQRMDSDLDGRSDYELQLYGLDDNSQIYYRLCVEYEDENDDETVTCGSVEDFRTDD